MAADLTLIGTVHLDSAARPVLMEWLESLRPDCIAVEISPFSVRYRQANQARWHRRLVELLGRLPPGLAVHPRLILLERQIAMPYEWDCAVEYARAHGLAACLAVDSEELASRELPCWEEDLLTMENILALTREPGFDLDAHFLSCYRQARHLMEEPLCVPREMHPLSWLGQDFWMRRELFLASRLRDAVKRHMRVVHVGGWMHVVQGSPWTSLADLLSDMGPGRLLVERPPSEGVARGVSIS